MEAEERNGRGDAPPSKKTAWASPSPSGGSSRRTSASGELSPEQLTRMEKKKTEAEARFLAKKLGAVAIGPSWMQALQSELKKNYMEKVITVSKWTSI